MAKGKQTEKPVQEEKPVEQEKKPVTNEMIYEGLIVLDLKMKHLIDVLDKIAGYVEDKRNGTLS